MLLELFWNNAKEHANYYIMQVYILGIYWDNGKKIEITVMGYIDFMA